MDHAPYCVITLSYSQTAARARASQAPGWQLPWRIDLGECVAATDFFTARGLVTLYVLFFLNPASHTVKIAGVTTNLGDAWMTQIARNLTDPQRGNYLWT